MNLQDTKRKINLCNIKYYLRKNLTNIRPCTDVCMQIEVQVGRQVEAWRGTLQCASFDKLGYCYRMPPCRANQKYTIPKHCVSYLKLPNDSSQTGGQDKIESQRGFFCRVNIFWQRNLNWLKQYFMQHSQLWDFHGTGV